MGFSNLPKSTTIDQKSGTSATLCRRYLAIQRSSPISIPSHGPIYIMMVMVKNCMKTDLIKLDPFDLIQLDWLVENSLGTPTGQASPQHLYRLKFFNDNLTWYFSMTIQWYFSMTIQWMWYWYKSWRWTSPHIGLGAYIFHFMSISIQMIMTYLYYLWSNFVSICVVQNRCWKKMMMTYVNASIEASPVVGFHNLSSINLWWNKLVKSMMRKKLMKMKMMMEPLPL